MFLTADQTPLPRVWDAHVGTKVRAVGRQTPMDVASLLAALRTCVPSRPVPVQQC